MRKILLSLCGAIALVAMPWLVNAASTDSQMPIDRIVAIVNEDVITQTELDRAMHGVEDQIRARNMPAPSRNVLRKQVLEREVLKQLQLQLAKNTGIIVDDNTLNNTIDNIASQNDLTLRQMRDVLERDGYDFAEYREGIRQDIIIARLHQREIENRVTVSEREIENFLATQYAQGNVNDEYRLAHILVSVPEAASAKEIREAREKAERILEKLRQGADFGQTAIAVSDGQQALEGGDLGWRKAGELPTLFSDHVRGIQTGEISEVIRSPSGFHIIKLLDKRAGEKHIVNQTHARHILIRPNELLSERDARNKLQQLRERIENGDDFATLARSHSDDRGSAAKGGDLGWTNPGELAPQFEDVMNQLQPGQISDAFQTPFGWHIVQVIDRRVLDNSEEYKRSKAREFLRQRKTEELLDSWLRQLRDEAYVEYKMDV